MAADTDTLTEQIAGDYEASQNNLSLDQKVQGRLSELEGLHRIYFNPIYRGGIPGKIGKKIIKRLTWPLFDKQVYFNNDVKEILIQTVSAVTHLQHEVKRLTEKHDRSETEIKKESGLWFNDPIVVGYTDDGVAYWFKTTERIVEKAFVLQTLARIQADSHISVLDIGSAESLLPYELASLGYSVTATDIRPIGLSHPNLKYVKGDICKPVFAESSFDCAVGLSTIEHIGLGWYGDEGGERLDHEAVRQIYRLLKPGGYFLLTVPYGVEAVTPLHRIYDKRSLQELVGPFTVEKAEYGVHRDELTLVVVSDESEAATKEHDPDNYLPGAVALLICRKMEPVA